MRAFPDSRRISPRSTPVEQSSSATARPPAGLRRGVPRGEARPAGAFGADEPGRGGGALLAGLRRYSALAGAATVACTVGVAF
ncbi:hypothetical protein ACWELJ_25120, partial [Nocardia sp. NPDC004582]